MGVRYTRLVAKVSYILFNVPPTSSQMTLHRKLFGDGSSNPAEPGKRLHMTKRTTYQLMEEQRNQVGENGHGQGGEVCTGSELDPLLTLPLSRTQHQSVHIHNGPSVVQDAYRAIRYMSATFLNTINRCIESCHNSPNRIQI